MTLGILGQTDLPESIVIRKYGMVVDDANVLFGLVSKSNKLLSSSGNASGRALPEKFSTQTFRVCQGAAKDDSMVVAWAEDDGTIELSGGNPVEYESSSSSGGHSVMRLRHLNSTPLDIGEWERLQSFTRLWKRLGCTIREADSALTAISKKSS
ncbi:uncharacterized protein LY79DRAFT_585158 [Colletotrichum navitas]|uniref:Uncharacterized protein n=1 Tax=Colletotrichum navitas TaxID=681940 RepID=A0AAD8PJI8_9PEZI|nr:uncharacterized protein LY79DRAFT_585158 [Colletotrichum navitas]KAK1565898.1 hypothetical protein LY79DRAFT_585158 [Colletotrichum navitas]